MKTYFLNVAVTIFLLSGIISAQISAEMIDEFGWVPCEDLRSRLDNFLATLSDRPLATGFVYMYEGKYGVTLYDRKKPRAETRPPVFGETAHRTNIFRTHFRFRKFDLSRILFVDGGFRDSFLVQFWIIPHGALPPPAQPTLEQMTFRKGKFAELECP